MPDIRAELHRLMTDTLADARNWTYAEIRPLAVPAKWKPGQRVTADCSKAVQYLSKWAGAPDPMNSGYGSYGNSQTLWANLQHLDAPGDLQIGDIVTFGPDGDAHAAMVLKRGSDPLLWSFGHQGAPNTYSLSQDRREKQYLRLPAPTYVPTPEERLKARTGWFAWVAWRLGEGDWRPYGRATGKVRPRVPRLIPPTWWLRYRAFLAARNRPNQSNAGATTAARTRAATGAP